jgi:hypothetical protein
VFVRKGFLVVLGAAALASGCGGGDKNAANAKGAKLFA